MNHKLIRNIFLSAFLIVLLFRLITLMLSVERPVSFLTGITLLGFSIIFAFPFLALAILAHKKYRYTILINLATVLVIIGVFYMWDCSRGFCYFLEFFTVLLIYFMGLYIGLMIDMHHKNKELSSDK